MIKKTFCLLVIASSLFLVSCKNNEVKLNENPTETQKAVDGVAVNNTDSVATKTANPNAKYATMDFSKKLHDFGTINQGDKVKTVFSFTNNGQADLIIVSASGSCGCTVPEYPKTPIKPGEKGDIKVEFNSSGKSGQQNKTVTIVANTVNGNEVLNITASITPKTGISK